MILICNQNNIFFCGLFRQPQQGFQEVVVGVGEGDVDLGVGRFVADAVAEQEIAVAFGCKVLGRCQSADLADGHFAALSGKGAVWCQAGKFGEGRCHNGGKDDCQ